MCTQFERLPGIGRDEVWLYDPGCNRKDGTSKHLRLRGLVLRGPRPVGAWHTNICRSGGRELRHRGLGCFRRQRHVRRDLAWLRGRLAAWWPGGENQRHIIWTRGPSSRFWSGKRGSGATASGNAPGVGAAGVLSLLMITCHSWLREGEGVGGFLIKDPEMAILGRCQTTAVGVAGGLGGKHCDAATGKAANLTAGGGAGLTGNGNGYGPFTGAFSFIRGGEGGKGTSSHGGFGGGGFGMTQAGGGGGFSGGGVIGVGDQGLAGGGGTYNGGLMQDDEAGDNKGNGRVPITVIY